MKPIVKNLIITGLCSYGLGLLLNLITSFAQIGTIIPGNSLADAHTEYILKTIVLYALSPLLHILIGVLIAFFAYRFLKKADRKRIIFLSSISGTIMLLHLVSTVLSFTPAIPQYILFSKLGIIDTYFVYIITLFKNGAPLMFLGSLLIFISGIIEILKKEKGNEIQ